MRIKLTERAVERIKAPTGNGKQALHWDAELKGFGVLCSGVSKTKTYVVQRDVAGRTRRVTIAQTNVLSLSEARRRAEAVLADFYLGRDPKAGRRGSVDLRGTLADYLAARKNLRPKSVEDYRATIERYLAAWLDRPLREITPEMVEARHRAIAAEVLADGRYSGEASANGAMRTLRLLWNFAKEREPNLPENPVTRLRRQWFPVSRRERMVRADDLPAFYRAVLALPNPVHRDYLLLLLVHWPAPDRGGDACVGRCRLRPARHSDSGDAHQGRAQARSADERYCPRPAGRAARCGRRQVHLSVEQRERPCRRAEVSASACGGGVRHRDQRT